MKKTLIALLLGLSSCVSQQLKCPDDEDLLRAGFRIYCAAEMIESNRDFDQRLAKSNYCMAGDFYFACEGDQEHKDRHYQEAMERASQYFGLSPEVKKRMDRNVRKIRESIKATSLR